MLVQIKDGLFVNTDFIVSVRKFEYEDSNEVRVVIDTLPSSNSKCSSFIVETASEAEANKLIESLNMF